MSDSSSRHDDAEEERRIGGRPIAFAKPRWESGGRGRHRRLRCGVGAVRVNRHIDRDCIDRRTLLGCRTKWNTHCAGKVVALRYFHDYDDVVRWTRKRRAKERRTRTDNADRHAGFVLRCRWYGGANLSDRSGECFTRFIIKYLLASTQVTVQYESFGQPYQLGGQTLLLEQR